MKILRKTILLKGGNQHVHRKMKLDSLKNLEYGTFDFKTSHYRLGETLRAPEAGRFQNL